MNATLKIVSNSYPPVSFFGLLIQDGEIRLTTCPFSNQKSVVRNAKHLGRIHGYTIASVIPYRDDKKSRSLVRPGTRITRESTIYASHPTGGGVFLDCRHCGQSLHLSGKPLFNPRQCPGLDIKEIEALFRKAHTHRR